MPAMDGEGGGEDQPAAGKGSVVELLARQVHEGGVDGVTRFQECPKGDLNFCVVIRLQLFSRVCGP
jgi:hypothetical protein